LESALAEAGFYVPLLGLNRWYRKSLADTGIPHVFVLDVPWIPACDDMPYQHRLGSPEYERDMTLLRDITAEYRSRVQAEYDQEQSAITRETRHAHVIYSTG
jgi:hypothetical protein